MFERLLNKQLKPSFEDMINYSGESGRFWRDLDSFMQANYELQTLIRFPYGNSEGWAIKYSHRTKHICDVFAEANAFTVFFRIDEKDIDRVKNGLSDYSKSICDSKYPCGAGGWVRYRVMTREQLDDAIKLLTAKIKPKK
jgi:hypothetical protein